MIKKILTLALISGLLFACNNTKTNTESAQADETAKITELTIAKLMADPEAYADQDIKVTGTVSHVCKHGGKRMFIFGENSEEMILIVTGEEMTPFLPEVEGSDLEVIGKLIVNKIDEAYLVNMENEIAEGNEVEDRQMHDHSEGELSGEEGQEIAKEEHQHGEGEGAEEHNDDPNAKIKRHIENMRAEIAESETGYVLEYFVECKEFKAIETAE